LSVVEGRAQHRAAGGRGRKGGQTGRPEGGFGGAVRGTSPPQGENDDERQPGAQVEQGREDERTGPLILAALLYLGAGLALDVVLALRRRSPADGAAEAALRAAGLPPLAAATPRGAVLGPALHDGQ